jgi:hypothetical protein
MTMTEPESLETRYPMLAQWVHGRGWVEIGADANWGSARVRVLDEGGMVWEGGDRNASLEELLALVDQALRDWWMTK